MTDQEKEELSSLAKQDDEEKKQTGSSMAATCFNFINSIVGSGLVGMPFALHEAGFGMGILLFVIVGIAADYSILLLLKAGFLSGTHSYQDMMFSAFGTPGFVLVTILQFLLPFLAMVSYNVIIGDTITKVLLRLTGEYLVGTVLSHRQFIIFLITVLVTLPLSLYRNIGKLGKWSGLSIVLTLFNICVVYTRLATMATVLPPTPDAYQFAKVSIPQALGLLGIAIVCHHNSFLLHKSLENPNRRRWSMVTHISVFTATGIMLVFAIGGYLSFTGHTQGDILENFCSNDDLANMARLAFAFIVMITYPLDCFVAREVVENALFRGEKVVQPFWRHAMLTVSIAGVIGAVSMLTDCVGVVMELNGVLVASPLAFVIPAICVIRLRSEPIFSSKNIGPLLMALFGTTLSIVGFTTVLMEIYEGFPCSHGDEMEYCASQSNRVVSPGISTTHEIR